MLTVPSKPILLITKLPCVGVCGSDETGLVVVLDESLEDLCDLGRIAMTLGEDGINQKLLHYLLRLPLPQRGVRDVQRVPIGDFDFVHHQLLADLLHSVVHHWDHLVRTLVHFC